MADQANLIHAGGMALNLDGVLIPFTTATPNFNANVEAVTDSTDYHPTKKVVFISRRPRVRENEISIEFNFRLDVTKVGVLAKLMGNDPLPVTMISDRPDSSEDFLFGDYWISECELEVNVAEDALITGSATLQSEGEFDFAPLS